MRLNRFALLSSVVFLLVLIYSQLARATTDDLPSFDEAMIAMAKPNQAKMHQKDMDSLIDGLMVYRERLYRGATDPKEMSPCFPREKRPEDPPMAYACLIKPSGEIVVAKLMAPKPLNLNDDFLRPSGRAFVSPAHMPRPV
jgi:hypothetical protein